MSYLPLLNAIFNLISTYFLIRGFLYIKKKDIKSHKKMMFCALFSSALFLTSYLIYHYNAPAKYFTGDDIYRTIYLIILIPHVILAIVMLPMIFVTFLYGLRGQINEHKKIAKITLFIWLYVSFTGVLLYVYIYILFNNRLKVKEPKEQAILIHDTRT